MCKGLWDARSISHTIHTRNRFRKDIVIDSLLQLLQAHPSLLFMKGTPQYPMCASSQRAVDVLAQADMPYTCVNVLADPVVRANLPSVANCSTFPQFYIQGEFIGGCDVLAELAECGELARLVDDVKQMEENT